MKSSCEEPSCEEPSCILQQHTQHNGWHRVACGRLLRHLCHCSCHHHSPKATWAEKVLRSLGIFVSASRLSKGTGELIVTVLVLVLVHSRVGTMKVARACGTRHTAAGGGSYPPQRLNGQLGEGPYPLKVKWAARGGVLQCELPPPPLGARPETPNA